MFVSLVHYDLMSIMASIEFPKGSGIQMKAFKRQGILSGNTLFKFFWYGTSTCRRGTRGNEKEMGQGSLHQESNLNKSSLGFN